MKILWVADFGLQHNIGGSQRTDSFIIQEGQKRGHEIQFLNHDTPSDILNGSFDLVVSNNLESLCNRRDVFNFIVGHDFHVRYEHDSNAYLPQQMRIDLFNSAKHQIFLSQFHLNKFRELYGDIFPRPEIVTSPIDTSLFTDAESVREDKTLYVGFLHFLKGTHNFFREALTNPDREYVVAGWGSPQLERAAKGFKNVEWLGKVPYEDMPQLFNRYQRMYYHPAKFEPFCRSVGEALLCGMELDCSDNIGAMHDMSEYGLDGLKRMCQDAPSKFWEMVE